MADPAPQPIVIIGAARSGTKFLRACLGASRNVAEIPYDVGYIWRYGNENHPDDALSAAQASDEAIRYIRGQILDAKAPCVLEKTVANSLRVEFVQRVFPEARFVHLVRDGREVVASALRQWQAGTDWRYLLRKMRSFPLRNYRYGIWYALNKLRGLGSGRGVAVWGPRYPGIDADVRERGVPYACARQWHESVAHSMRGLAGIAPEQQMEVRYETLVADTAVLERLCEFCGIADTDAVVDYFRANLRPDSGRSPADALTGPGADAMLSAITPTLRELGYLDREAPAVVREAD